MRRSDRVVPTSPPAGSSIGAEVPFWSDEDEVGTSATATPQKQTSSLPGSFRKRFEYKATHGHGDIGRLEVRLDELSERMETQHLVLLSAIESLRDQVGTPNQVETAQICKAIPDTLSKANDHGRVVDTVPAPPSPTRSEAVPGTGDDSPWANCLRGDRLVQDLLKQLRADCSASANHRSFKRRKSEDRISREEMRYRESASGGAEEGGDTTGERTISEDLGATGVSPDRLRRSVGDVGERLKAPWCSCELCNRWWPVASPNGRFSTCWSLFVAVLICWCAISVPLELAFEASMRRSYGEDGWRVWEAHNLTIDFLFLIDICISFRTGYFVDGQLVRDGWLVSKHYLKGSFVIDLLGAFPLNFFMPGGGDDGNSEGASRLNRNLRLLRIVKLNRLLRLSKLSKYLKYVELMVSFNPSAMRVVKLLLLMACCCLWMGCLWWFVADIELSNGDEPYTNFNSWQPSQELMQHSSLGPQIAAAYFWGAGFVSATVPMDILPSTEAEYYVTAACAMVGLFFNAFVIGSMASALSSLDSKKQICRGKLETIGHYLLLHNVPSELRARILEYYEYLFTSSQSMDDLRLLRDLPPSLGTRLALMMNHRLVVRGASFFSTLADHTLLAVLARLRPEIFVPAEIICVDGQPLKAVYFIQKGRVSCKAEAEAEARTLEIGESFGLQTVELLLDEHWASTAQQSPLAAAESLHALQSVLGAARAREAATAITYCDLVGMRLTDLPEVLAAPGALLITRQATSGKSAERLRRASRLVMRSAMSRVQGGRRSSFTDNGDARRRRGRPPH